MAFRGSSKTGSPQSGSERSSQWPVNSKLLPLTTCHLPLTTGLILLCLLIWPPALTFAQGCALCYNTAAAAKASAIQALRSGILILGIPPLLIFGAFLVYAWRSRNRVNDAALQVADPNREIPERELNQWLRGRERTEPSQGDFEEAKEESHHSVAKT